MITIFFYQGCGFIGRHLVKHLLDLNAAQVIRVVDKAPPELCYLGYAIPVEYASYMPDIIILLSPFLQKIQGLLRQ